MKYIMVRWVHSHPDEPIWIFSEVTDDLWELRKVEIYVDGTKGYADQIEETGTTQLGVEPWPPLDQIAADPEFQLKEISCQEFESVWADRNKR